MSQHHFYVNNHNSYHILIGWDKPLQGFFMIIERSDNIDQPFWSNLNETPAHPKSLTRFIEVLNGLGLWVPPQMLEEVQRDGEENMGNKEVLHQLCNGFYLRRDENNEF